MSKKIYKNFFLLNLNKYIVFLKSFLFPKRYDLKIKKIKYIDYTYILSLQIIDQMQHIKLNIHQIFDNKTFINNMSPIDAYICGIIHSLDVNGLILNNTDYLIDFFKSFNHGYVIESIIKVVDISFYTGEVKIRAGNCTRIMKYNEFIYKPFLLNGLRSIDTSRIGAISLDYYLGGLCLN